MSLYKINPKYSLILKNDKELMIVKNNKLKLYQVPEDEIVQIQKLMQTEMFPAQDTKIFQKLLKKNILIKCLNQDPERNTHSYLEVYTNSQIDMNVLKSKKVFIIGLGGVGCEVITHLVGNGVKKFVILDFDIVDETNLNRQYLYTYNDISKNKGKLIAKKIKEKDPSTKVVKYNKFINCCKDVVEIIKKEQIDMVVCAADTPFLDIRIAILEACIATKTPCIFGGVNILTGQYGPTFVDTKKMKKYCQELEQAKKLVLCNSTNKASFGPTNTIISAYMAMDIIMTLLGKKKYINSLNKIKEINFISREDYEKKKF